MCCLLRVALVLSLPAPCLGGRTADHLLYPMNYISGAISNLGFVVDSEGISVLAGTGILAKITKLHSHYMADIPEGGRPAQPDNMDRCLPHEITLSLYDPMAKAGVASDLGGQVMPPAGTDSPKYSESWSFAMCESTVVRDVGGGNAKVPCLGWKHGAANGGEGVDSHLTWHSAQGVVSSEAASGPQPEGAKSPNGTGATSALLPDVSIGVLLPGDHILNTTGLTPCIEFGMGVDVDYNIKWAWAAVVDMLVPGAHAVMDVLAVLAVLLCVHEHGVAKRVAVALVLVPVVFAVCPGCSGNAASCTYDTDGKCPTIDLPTANAGVVAGLASAAAATLTLTNVISPRFLRMFTRAHLNAVLQLVRRPSPGTIFELKPDTKLTAVLSAVSSGQVTMEQALVAFAGFIDDEADEAKRKALVERYKLLTSTKDIGKYTGTGSTVTDTGVYSWLWGKITVFVDTRGMQIATMQVEVGSTPAASTSNVLSSTIKRFKDPMEFTECLNLFVMFGTALGLFTAVAITEFLEHVVYDTYRMRGYPWQLAHELLVVMFRRIEDSGGKLSIVNCIDDSHLNTVIDEATTNAKHHYPNLTFFRTFAGKANGTRVGGGGADGDTGDVRWNGKFTATSDEACWFFNSGQKHTAAHLHPDGTCKRNHVCDRYLTDGTKCMGKEGTPGHSRANCDHPRKGQPKSK